MSKLKTRRWDSAEHLKTDQDVVDYVDACLAEAGDDTAMKFQTRVASKSL